MDELVEEPLANPLAALCKLLGLTTRAAARLSGTPISSVAQAISETPVAAVASYIRIMEVLGANLRMRKAAPIAIWISIHRLDELYFDNAFRAAHCKRNPNASLKPVPNTRVELRTLVAHFRRTQFRQSFGWIVDYMEKGYICTAEGKPNWRRSTIGNLMKGRWKRLLDDDVPVLPDEESLRRWRELLLGWIVTDCSGADPFFRVRYGLKQTQEGDQIRIETTEVITEKPREWFMDELRKIPWINGAWNDQPSLALNQSPATAEMASASPASSGGQTTAS